MIVGGNNMQNHKIFNYRLIALLMLSIANVQAANRNSMVELKCHVDLLGGTDIIHFTLIEKQKRGTITQVLTGKKVPTALSKEQQVIYKVNECVDLNDSFSSTAAKSRDLLTAR